MDKQQMATAGIIGLVSIGLVVYTIITFGSKKTDTKEAFNAPALVNEQVQTKEDYDLRMKKELREMPRKPKEATILLDPFENVDSSTEEANLVFPEPDENREDEKPEINYNSTPKPKIQHRAVKNDEPPEIVLSVDTSKAIIAPQVRSKARYNDNISTAKQQSTSNTFSASVFGEQKIFNSSLLKIRLLSPITLESGIVIPRNTFVSGTVAFAVERIKIQITSIPYQNTIHKVNLSVYDANDGLEGIYVQGNAINDINDQSSSDAVDEVFARPGISSVGIIKGVGSEIKSWTRKKSVTILDEHRLFLK